MKKYFTFNKKTKLEINLEKLANENNFKYVDLTSLIKKNYNKDINDLFLSCNNHFNKFGNEILTNLILNNLQSLLHICVVESRTPETQFLHSNTRVMFLLFRWHHLKLLGI